MSKNEITIAISYLVIGISIATIAFNLAMMLGH